MKARSTKQNNVANQSGPLWRVVFAFTKILQS